MTRSEEGNREQGRRDSFTGKSTLAVCNTVYSTYSSGLPTACETQAATLGVKLFQGEEQRKGDRELVLTVALYRASARSRR